MPPDALAEARGWLARADQDLQVARLAQPVPAAVAYHAQQALQLAEDLVRFVRGRLGI